MIFQWGGGGGGGPDPLSPLWIRAWDRTMYTLIEIYWKPILTCASAFVRLFAYFLSHAQIFKLTKLVFHSGLIWIQTVFANVNRDRKGEHILSGKSKCIDRSTSRERERERERERCVCSFWISSFFNSENSPTYFKVSCISLQKILIDEITL